MCEEKIRALEARIRELEEQAKKNAQIKQDLLEKQDQLRMQNIMVIRKSLDLSDIKRDLEDKNLELKVARSEFKKQNISLIKKSIELSDVMRELEDKHYDLQLSKHDLEESRERFRSLVESTSDWVWEVDVQGVYTYASPKVKDLLGYEPEEVIGKKPFSFMTVSDGIRTTAIFEEAAKNAVPIERLENTNVHKDGHLVVLETSGAPVFGAEGECVGFRGIDRDITEKKALQSQLAHASKMEAIGQLAGGIAHDFNNLLTPIIGYSDLLLMKAAEDNPFFDELVQIGKAALRGQDLTRQILAFSRRQVLEMTVMSLEDVIVSLQKTLRRTIREDIEIHTSFCGGDDCINADISQIEQIIMNLAVNSQDAMPQGGEIKIGISRQQLDGNFLAAHPGSKLGEFVKLEFSDTGCGMTPGVAKCVFDPFFTTKEKGRGTGLGMATVYGIVKQHGGCIYVDSLPGEGTVISVYFPPTTQSRERVHDKPSEMRHHGTATILVVEDEKDVRQVVCEILKAHGYEVHSAEDAESCLRLVRNGLSEFDLLITDVIMPKMNGKELYSELTLLVQDMKVLFMSGYPDEVIASHGILDGETNFIQKPVSVKSLIPKVEKVLES